MNASQTISIPFGWLRQRAAERQASEPSASDVRVAATARPDPEPWSVMESGAQTALGAMFRILGR
jgi:hypothetical protein